ncbi:protein-methionine-sulfoxide reductase catalytic subunit MsrP [Pseudomarimonas arenosa]|uniref:Protein-methionine-sulfoxide reductase catalytic subunit MsrP n=1 Tax=Pseudomarimonas arenosa TaxID=2774145 RepID=A0AAW3ZHH9_9GAMM|nr:protein-methionine-sulfoxide reductase catalytic subunit MsrP [Pseudomarimonas arenosa]MBD8524577.1 protein-methionine-sulfoxide reductase catalytic subunit MsrP [Pseudomarimonas arenosa]
MKTFQLDPIPGSEITPESVYKRRHLLMGTVGGLLVAGCARSEPAAPTEATAAEAPAEEALTTFQHATNYNNFYEFGTGKDDPARYAHSLITSPWTVEIAGLAETTGRFDLADIVKLAPVEERIYRLRCVEGWSMVIPWMGIELGKVLAHFKPLADAQYVAFTTLADPKQMPGIRSRVLDWPYVEGLRLDEAMHPLTILATGMYGRDTLENQNGAPLRLVVPWKYGFKSIKSIVRIEFTKRRPPTSWNRSQPSEYGFYSNVNPGVDHPRWSQKTERRLAGDTNLLFAKRIPTRLFNGYDQVASLYSDMNLRKYF